MRTLAILGIIALSGGVLVGVAKAKTKTEKQITVKTIRTLYHAKAEGNSFFNNRLRQKLENAGVQFVKSRDKADALLESRGNWTKNGGFSGALTIKSRGGKIIWRETASRASGSNQMAFETLGDKFRAARSKVMRSSRDA